MPDEPFTDEEIWLGLTVCLAVIVAGALLFSPDFRAWLAGAIAGIAVIAGVIITLLVVAVSLFWVAGYVGRGIVTLRDGFVPKCPHCGNRSLGGSPRCPRCWKNKEYPPEEYEDD